MCGHVCRTGLASCQRSSACCLLRSTAPAARCARQRLAALPQPPQHAAAAEAAAVAHPVLIEGCVAERDVGTHSFDCREGKAGKTGGRKAVKDQVGSRARAHEAASGSACTACTAQRAPTPAPPTLSAKLTPMLQHQAVHAQQDQAWPAPLTCASHVVSKVDPHVAVGEANVASPHHAHCGQAGRQAGGGSQGSGGEGEGSAGLRYVGTLPE